jgi:ABC-type proline/glycine betaine transport system permease subunit
MFTGYIEKWTTEHPFITFMVAIVVFAIVIDIGVGIATWINDRMRG